MKKETIKKIIRYLEDEIGGFRGKVDNVVLGCTHYPLIQNEITQILGNVKFFNGAKGLAINLKNTIVKENILEINNQIENKECKILNEIEDNKLNIHFEDSSNSKRKEQRFFDLLNKV